MNTIQIKQADDVISSLEQTYKAAPVLPKGFIETLVNIAPWFSIIVGVISLFFMVFVSLIAFIGTIALMLTGNPFGAVASLFSLIIGIVQAVVLVLAFKPLKKREMYGWRLMGYSNLLSAISIVVSFIGSISISMNIGSLLFSAILMVIWLALYFQMKPYYK